MLHSRDASSSTLLEKILRLGFSIDARRGLFASTVSQGTLAPILRLAADLSVFPHQKSDGRAAAIIATFVKKRNSPRGSADCFLLLFMPALKNRICLCPPNSPQTHGFRAPLKVYATLSPRDSQRKPTPHSKSAASSLPPSLSAAQWIIIRASLTLSPPEIWSRLSPVPLSSLQGFPRQFFKRLLYSKRPIKLYQPVPPYCRPLRSNHQEGHCTFTFPFAPLSIFINHSVNVT